MKKNKVTILAVFCLICAMALSIFATSVKATTMEFGLQEYRKAREDGAQYAYKISDKYVWKIVTYNGQTIDYDKAIYCLKAEQGFYTSNPGVFRQEYDTSYNFKDKTSMPTLPVADEDYNAVMWILNHAYIESATTADQDKATLIANAQITGNLELSDDDIDVIQQLAIWYFTNKEDATYHTEFNGEPSLQVVLEAKKDSGGTIEDYKAIEDKNRTRFDQMETLFKYFITNAQTATDNTTNNNAPLSLDKTTPTAEASEDNYIIGPYKINKNDALPYTLNVKITDRNGNDLAGKYTLVDENKADITDKTITDLVGQTFYLKIPADTVTENKIDGIKFSIDGTYTTTNITYWTNSSNNSVQPVVVIEKTPQNFSDENEVLFTVSGKYSFKLIKVDSDDATKKLQGAEFEITTPSGKQTYTTDENGEISINDIEITQPGVDTITIQETKAPEPYKILLESPLTLNITKDVANGSYTATKAELEGYDENAVQIQDGVVTITVANQPKIFDLALKKWVSKAIVTNEDGTQTVTETGHTGDENPEPPAKVDLGRQDVNKVTVKFEFQIKITNEGEVAGYAKEVTDYIPEGLRFVQEDNPDWYTREPLNGRERVATKQLENTLLQPGESATVSIVLTWINGQDNMGLKTNIAEISQDDNEYDLPDIDSTPDNFKEGEDDIDDAPVMLTVALGDARIYLGVAAVAVVILIAGIFVIKKYAI